MLPLYDKKSGMVEAHKVEFLLDGEYWILLGKIVWPLLNSEFGKSLTGAMAGAFAGAMAAQALVERSAKRERVSSELRNTNVAIMLAFGICNTALALKSQHVKRMTTEFEHELNRFLEFQASTKTSPPSAPFVFEADLQRLPMPELPLRRLQDIVCGSTAATGRPLAITTALGGSIQALESCIEKRNALISEWKAAGGVSPPRYFGLPLTGGHVDTEFADSVRGIGSLTDDLIFFSKLLCEDLQAHGAKVRKSFRRNRSAPVPTVHEANFDTTKAITLIPSSKAYEDWLSSFKEERATRRSRFDFWRR